MIEINHNNTMVLLIGASDFPEDPAITPIPNVKVNIEHFKNSLVNPDIIGVPEANIMVSLNESRSHIERKLFDLCRQTNHKKYTLLVYYSGHGILSSEDYELYLTTYYTSRKYLETDAVNINDFKRDIRRSAAGRKIVFLDCCHSGAIIGAMGDRESTIQAELSGFEGTYVMTSAAEDTPALFPVENPDHPTYFTGKLLEILNNGLESNSEYCSLREIYQQIEFDLLQARLPRPQQSNINSADQIYFSRNRKYVKPRPADELAWEEALKKNNKWAYKDFKRQFPESSFVEEARLRIADLEEEECWKKAINRNTLFSLDDYLDTYPNGKYVDAANERLIELRKKEEQEEEENYWEQVEMAGDLVALETYLEAYPNGQYAQKCRAQIKRLKQEEKKKNEEEKALQKILTRHIQQLEQKADRLKKQGRYEAALELYYQVLDLQPDQQHSLQAVNQCQENIELAAAEAKNKAAASEQQTGKETMAGGLAGEQVRPLGMGKLFDLTKATFLAEYTRLVNVIFNPENSSVIPVKQAKEEDREGFPDEAEGTEAGSSVVAEETLFGAENTPLVTEEDVPVTAQETPLVTGDEPFVAEAVSPDVASSPPDVEEAPVDATEEDVPVTEEEVAPVEAEETIIAADKDIPVVAETAVTTEEDPPVTAETAVPTEEDNPAIAAETPVATEEDISVAAETPVATELDIPAIAAETTVAADEVTPIAEETVFATEAASPAEAEDSPVVEKAPSLFVDDALEVAEDPVDAAEVLPIATESGTPIAVEVFSDVPEDKSQSGETKPFSGDHLHNTWPAFIKIFRVIADTNNKVILAAVLTGLLAFYFIVRKEFFQPDLTERKPVGNTHVVTPLKSSPLLLADELYRQKKYTQSLKLYEASALDLNAEQMRRIAWIYEKGDVEDGVRQNQARSFSWYVKAAKSGNAQAMGKIGNLYYNGLAGVVAVKQDSAFYWYLLSARNGDSIAMFNLGVMYRYGIGVEKSQDSANTWLHKASEHDIKEATELLH